MPIQRFTANASADQLANALKQDGVVIVEKLFPASLAEAVQQEAEPILSQQTTGGGAFFGDSIRSVSEPIVQLPSYREMLINPLLLSTGDAVLGANSKSWTFSASGMLAVQGGGEKNQPLHRDDLIYEYLPRGTGQPTYVMSTLFAISDFTIENGATRFVPGSHLWETDREANEDEVEQATMPKGSIAIWLGHTLHGFAKNQTDEQRLGIPLTSCLGWLRQEQNLYYIVSPEEAANYPEILIQKIGYKQQGIGLGYVPNRPPENHLGAA